MSTRFLIWSNEHNSWWRPGSMGYTRHVEAAGRYTLEQALQICNGANYGWDMDHLKRIPNEMPIAEDIAVLLQAGGPK